MKEEWRDIAGYNGIYKISNMGRIISYKTNKPVELIPYTNKRSNGYLVIGLSDGKKRTRYTVHRLVANHFIENPENKTQVNHKDGNKLNNCINNLEWVTPSENVKHSINMGLRTFERECTGKFCDFAKEYNENRKKSIVSINIKTGEEKQFESINEAARTLQCNKGGISHVLNGHYGKHKGYLFVYK